MFAYCFIILNYNTDLCYFYYANFLDPRMIRAALSPFSETQRVCIRWLLRYFELYGDDSPNKDEVMVQVMLKNQVHEHYKRQMIGQHREYVGLERFYELWNVIYPKHRQRPYVLRYTWFV